MARNIIKPTARAMNIPGTIMNQAPWIMKTPGSAADYYLNYVSTGHEHVFAGPKHEYVELNMNIPG